MFVITEQLTLGKEAARPRGLAARSASRSRVPVCDFCPGAFLNKQDVSAAKTSSDDAGEEGRSGGWSVRPGREGQEGQPCPLPQASSVASGTSLRLLVQGEEPVPALPAGCGLPPPQGDRGVGGERFELAGSRVVLVAGLWRVREELTHLPVHL